MIVTDSQCRKMNHQHLKHSATHNSIRITQMTHGTNTAQTNPCCNYQESRLSLTTHAKCKRRAVRLQKWGDMVFDKTLPIVVMEFTSGRHNQYSTRYFPAAKG